MRISPTRESRADAGESADQAGGRSADSYLSDNSSAESYPSDGYQSDSYGTQGDRDLADRAALRRVAGLSTELTDVT
ncbi:MAG: GTPase HflX, partial [Nakamurella sp.]